MKSVPRPDPLQEAALNEKAAILRAAYAAFPRPLLEPYKESTWQYLKGLTCSAMERHPAEFDWRDRLDIPPAKFQGRCHSCTSYAASAAIEISTMIARRGTIDVSAQHMHTCIVHRGATNPADICAFGIEPRRLLKLLKEIGYAVSLPDDTSFLPASCPTTSIHATLRDFIMVATSCTRSQLLQGPLITDMYVWNDFFDYTTNRSQTYTPDTTLGHPVLHSVCVVGYNSEGWIIKNSFGPGWGDGSGFATVAKDTCGLLTTVTPAGLAQRPAYFLQV